MSYDNLSLDESLELLNKQNPDNPLITHIIQLYNQDKKSLVEDYQFEIEQLEKYKSYICVIMKSFIDEFYFNSPSCDNPNVKLHPRLYKRHTIEDLYSLINIDNSEYPVYSYVDYYERYDNIEKYFEELSKLVPWKYDLEESFKNTYKYITLIEQNGFEIKLKDGQPPQYYIEIMDVSCLIYDLILNDRKVEIVIGSIYWIMYVFSGNELESYMIEDEEIREKYCNEIKNHHTDDDSSLHKMLVDGILNPRIKELQELIPNYETLSSSSPSTPLINSLRESFTCFTHNYSEEKFTESFSLVDTMYLIIKDAILNSDTFMNSTLFHQFVTLISHWRELGTNF